MATRKIRLTLSGTQLDGVGPLVDIDFNSENLDVDVDVDAVTGTNTLVKEYTVDVAPGTYNLDITFKNDGNDQEATGQDRNLTIESVEFADDGVNYTRIFLNQTTVSNLPDILYNQSGRAPIRVAGSSTPNPDFNPALPATDATKKTYEHEGDNPEILYEDYHEPAIVYSNRVVSIAHTFS